MKSPVDPTVDPNKTASRISGNSKIDYDAVLMDMRAGMRTKDFLSKYKLTLNQFEELLKTLIRQRRLTIEDYKAWKSNRPQAAHPTSANIKASGHSSGSPQGTTVTGNVTTYVISDPQNNSWAMQLFSTPRDRMKGATFKVNLHGKKYSFVIEEMLFRGQVEMLADSARSKSLSKSKREEALDFISKYGWAAYLEKRAISANLEANQDSDAVGPEEKARLVLLHCRNQTFVAALHTPAPAINLYVGTSLDSIRLRLSKSIKINQIIS